MTKNFDILVEKYLNIVEESITYTVGDSETNPSEIGEISYYVAWRNLYPLIEKTLSKEQLEEWNNKRSMDWFTPDGDGYFAKEGIINLYTTGLPTEFLPKLVGAAKYYLTEKGITVTGEIIKNKSNTYDSEVYRIPVKVTEEISNPPEMNLSNRNSHIFLSEVLGYSNDDIEAGSFRANELLMKIEQIEDNEYIINKASLPSKQDGNVYEGGLPPEQIERYIDRLKEICEWAIANNYTYISAN